MNKAQELKKQIKLTVYIGIVFALPCLMLGVLWGLLAVNYLHEVSYDTASLIIIASVHSADVMLCWWLHDIYKRNVFKTMLMRAQLLTDIYEEMLPRISALRDNAYALSPNDVQGAEELRKEVLQIMSEYPCNDLKTQSLLKEIHNLVMPAIKIAVKPHAALTSQFIKEVIYPAVLEIDQRREEVLSSTCACVAVENDKIVVIVHADSEETLATLEFNIPDIED